MYKKRKSLKSFLSLNFYNDELFSRNSMNTIIRALLEPVANQNASSIMFVRFKNKEGLEGLIKRLEYCTNVEMIDTNSSGVLIKDDYVELEFIIFTSARYNFALLWDYSEDKNKNYTKGFFLANSRNVNDVYEVLQANMNTDYRSRFYLHKPERRENELLNEALFNVFKKLNNSIEENLYKNTDDFVVDLSDDDNIEEKIREQTHEIKNQLSVLDVYCTLLEKQTGKNKNIEMIKKASSMISISLGELKNYDESIHEIILQDVIEESVSIMDAVLLQHKNKIVFLNTYNFDIKIYANENKMLSVLNNLLKNADEAANNDEITVELNVDKHYVYIDITNHGKPIEEHIRKRIFDKGFTTKSKGSGIGLYSVKNILSKYSAKIELLKSTPNGTTFRISFPLG
ncbi:MAG: HAMP domain-containing histidine kinase [Candidatus Gastranaerophilales bacterium]|nr:HAMP domain-containing histidine kinase [Candidatus Gastranaerophilales bacterium]